LISKLLLIVAFTIALQVVPGWNAFILTPVTNPFAVGIMRSKQSEIGSFATLIEMPSLLNLNPF
jgi:hypothetical protein